MHQIIVVTVKGIFRDRVFRGIAMSALFFLLIPSISTLSMRQVTELSITLSLSLISFMLLLLSVFLGGSSLWKDLERRFAYGVLSLPISRTTYLLGRFFAVALFLFFTSAALGAVACLTIKYVTVMYPPQRPVLWAAILFSILYTGLKYILLVAFAFLLSTVSTSFFLPIFGALSVFFIGNTTQAVYDFLHSPSAQNYPPVFKQAGSFFYYLLPNLSSFDLSANAVYGINLSPPGLALTLAYFGVYTAILLTLAAIIFTRREVR